MRRSKVCTMCKLEKVADQFYRATGGSLQSRCKDCHRLAARESARRRAPERRVADRDRKRHQWATDPAYRARKYASELAWRRRMREARAEEAAA